jgi:hypothetical protein
MMSAATQLQPSALLGLPRSPLARDAIELLLRHANASLSNHSIRSYLFARMVAQLRGLQESRDYADELLFCACILHDIGVTDAAGGKQRFEVDGADVAAELLTQHQIPAPQVDLVWQAIALNTSPGIVERRGVIPALTLAGVSLDFGFQTELVSDAEARLIHEAYPRLSIGRTLASAIAAQAGKAPQNAPLFSLSAQLLRERAAASHTTEIERLAQLGRWGE